MISTDYAGHTTEQLADVVRAANDARLAGALPRADHAAVIRAADAEVTRRGITWQTINDIINGEVSVPDAPYVDCPDCGGSGIQWPQGRYGCDRCGGGATIPTADLTDDERDRIREGLLTVTGHAH